MKSKPNNSVDLLINLIVLEYLVRNNTQNKEKKKLIKFLKKNKGCFEEDSQKISRYYISEGYLLYVLSKVNHLLEIDVERLIRLKIGKIKNKTDFGFLVLASSKLNPKIKKRFEKAEGSSLELFQIPRLKLSFSCPLLDKVVRDCAKIKIGEVYFDEHVAKTYSNLGGNLYNYTESSKNLIKLIEKYKLNNEKILELGVGTANFSKYLLDSGFCVIGVDISKEMLRIAKEKTKNIPKAEYVLQDITKLKIQPVGVMYSHNFIDFESGNVEIWTKNLEECKKAIKSISVNLKKQGILFIHKKERKKEGKTFNLFNRREICGNVLKNIYIYKDEEILMRKECLKTILSEDKFIKIMNENQIKLVEETNSWLVFRKN